MFGSMPSSSSARTTPPFFYTREITATTATKMLNNRSRRKKKEDTKKSKPKKAIKQEKLKMLKFTRTQPQTRKALTMIIPHRSSTTQDQTSSTKCCEQYR